MTSSNEQPKLQFAESDVIETMAPLARDFLSRVLDLDYDDCFISDESSLSDFATQGMPEGLVADGASYAQTLDAWDCWVLDHIDMLYGHRPADTAQSLVSILGAIERLRSDQLRPSH